MQEAASQVAGRILAALVDRDANRNRGPGRSLEHELARARRLASRTDHTSTFEMERLEALSGAVESIEASMQSTDCCLVRPAAAMRLLEHLALSGGF